MKKNAKKIQKQKTQKTFMKKTADSAKNWKKQKKKSSRAFTEFCEGKGIQQSMSKAGCPYDNSPMESFYGTFKSEFIRQNRFETDQELNESTLDYVYGYYNHIRPHSSNGYMTPFEKRYSNQ